MADRLSPYALPPEHIDALFGPAAHIMRPRYGPPAPITPEEQERAKWDAVDQRTAAALARASAIANNMAGGPQDGIRARSVGRPQSQNIEDRRFPSLFEQIGGAFNNYMDWAAGQSPYGLTNQAQRFASTPSFTKDVIDTLIAEAGGNPEGLAAVAWVIQNRANQWGLTPDQVVKQKGQFEGYSNPGHKSVQAQKDAKVRAAAEKAWNAVQTGSIPDPTNGGTSFRAKGTKQPAPYGTVEIGGNVFALGSAKPNSALAAINAAVPTPMARPASLSAYADTQRSAPQGSYTLDPPNIPLNPSLPPRASSWQEAGGPPMRGDIPLPRPRPTPPQPVLRAPVMTSQQRSAVASVPGIPAPPARALGTSSLAPATKVQTVRIDPMTNQVITREPLPSERVRPATVDAALERARQAAATVKPNPAPPPKLPSVAAKPAPVSAPALTAAQRSALAHVDAAPAAVPRLPMAKPIQPVKVASNGTYAAPPAPFDPSASGKSQARLPVSAYVPVEPPAAAVDAANKLAAPALPRMPLNPTLALIAARTPTMPVPAPVITAPRPPARIPLSQVGGVNPLSQVIPGVQARFGQGLLGGLFNLFTAGVVPQANTTPRSAAPAPIASSNDLRPTTSSIFSENAGLPRAMSATPEMARRWLGDGY
jgi:hypothetical protein